MWFVLVVKLTCLLTEWYTNDRPNRQIKFYKLNFKAYAQSSMRFFILHDANAHFFRTKEQRIVWSRRPPLLLFNTRKEETVRGAKTCQSFDKFPTHWRTRFTSRKQSDRLLQTRLNIHSSLVRSSAGLYSEDSPPASHHLHLVYTRLFQIQRWKRFWIQCLSNFHFLLIIVNNKQKLCIFHDDQSIKIV